MSTRGLYGFRANGQERLFYNGSGSYPTGLGLEIVEFAQNLPPGLAEKIAAMPDWGAQYKIFLQNSEHIEKLEFEKFRAQHDQKDPGQAERIAQIEEQIELARKTPAGAPPELVEATARFFLNDPAGAQRGEACSRAAQLFAQGDHMGFVQALGSFGRERSLLEELRSPFPAFPAVTNNAFAADSIFCEYAYVVNMDSGMLEFYVGFNKNPRAPGRFAALSKRDEAEYFGIELALEIPLADLPTMAPSFVCDLFSYIDAAVHKQRPENASFADEYDEAIARLPAAQAWFLAKEQQSALSQAVLPAPGAKKIGL